MYWLEGYGGGLWLPFSDASSGVDTYGGGRYLYDTIKGADLGIAGAEIVLDFNFAYNPSCAYDDRWSWARAGVRTRGFGGGKHSRSAAAGRFDESRGAPDVACSRCP